MSWRVVAALLLPLAAAAGVEEVTSEAQFKKILSDNPAVVVDFYSCAASVCTGAARTARGRACASPPRGRRQTCGPCIMMAPIFKEVAREYEGRLKLIKVDVQRSYVGVQAPGRQQRLPACASPTPCRRLSTASSRRRLSPPPLRRRPRRLRPNRPGRRHSPAARALCPCSRVLFTQPERLPHPPPPTPPAAAAQIRSMPTFHFYLHGLESPPQTLFSEPSLSFSRPHTGKLENQFSGGDERGLKQMSQALSAKAPA